MTRAVVYARFSTDRQDEASIIDQFRVCRERAELHGWSIAAEYSDDGVSGAALGNRPGARAALEACAAGDVLLVNDLSRLARSQDLAPLIARLRHRGVRVVGVQDSFDSDSRTASMQAGLSGIMSEEFRRLVADRTRSALELRALEGRPTGGKAYSDAEILREIFRRFADGESMKAIAGDLNRRGVPSPGADWKVRGGAGTRKRWLVSALHAILHNERYAGRLIWNRRRWSKDPDTGRRVARERPRADWIIQEVEPVIDVTTWERVQARFASHPGGKSGARRFLLSGILECDVCGSKMIVMGGSQQRYVCGTHHAGGEHACPNGTTVPRKVAEERILEPVVEQLLSPAAIERGVRYMRQERARMAGAPNPARDELRELERLVREGVLSAEVAAPAIAEARRRAATPDEYAWPSEALWRAEVEAMGDVVRGEDAQMARACLQRLLGTIRCRPVSGGLVAELRARRVMLKTGTGATDGRWVGSGGPDRVFLPTSARAAPGAS